MDEKNKQWFTNKDLFILINELQGDLAETKAIIKKYNGLYSKLTEVKQDVDEIKSVQKGKQSVGEAIKSWGGWLFGLVSLIFMLIKFYGGM